MIHFATKVHMRRPGTTEANPERDGVKKKKSKDVRKKPKVKSLDYIELQEVSKFLVEDYPQMHPDLIEHLEVSNGGYAIFFRALWPEYFDAIVEATGYKPFGTAHGDTPKMLVLVRW